MGEIRKSSRVKLIIGFIFSDTKYLAYAQKYLKKLFGPIDFSSQVVPFDYTDYYRDELGTNLKRCFTSFKKVIDPEELVRIKHITNHVEKKFCRSSCRSINIDPGYLDLSKFVLATTKDYSHRIYLGRGIYAEITLSFQKKSFSALPWTYPDYRSAEYIEIFNQIRETYRKQIQ